jgi:hypothetical protein
MTPTYAAPSPRAQREGLELKWVTRPPPSQLAPAFAGLLKQGSPYRVPYDVVLGCTGFRPNRSMFAADDAVHPKCARFACMHEAARLLTHTARVVATRRMDDKHKYPLINEDFESVNVRNLYFAGALAHGPDWRKSSGGFVHGCVSARRADVPLPRSSSRAPTQVPVHNRGHGSRVRREVRATAVAARGCVAPSGVRVRNMMHA